MSAPAEIWVNWMDVGGSIRDVGGYDNTPISRVVAFTAYEDAVRVNDLLTPLDTTDADGYAVVAANRLTDNDGWRLELTRDAGI